MRKMSKMINAVLLLAALSFATSLIILFSPLGNAGQELADRGTLSGAVSGVFGVILGIIAIIIASLVNSSDYKAEEDVKAHTAQLLSCLRSIIMKGIVISQKPTNAAHPITFIKEKEIINGFLSSTTGFAYSSWVGYKSEAAKKKPEEWRIFWLRLIAILDSDDSSGMIKHAFALEGLLAGLSKADVQRISGYVSDLAGAFSAFRHSGDLVLKAAREVYSPDQNPDQIPDLRDKLLYLKNQGVNDPTIDLWLAILDPAGGSPERVKAALDAGADKSMTDTTLLAKYEAHLRNYDASDKANRQ